jgi:hypothetical protein
MRGIGVGESSSEDEAEPGADVDVDADADWIDVCDPCAAQRGQAARVVMPPGWGWGMVLTVGLAVRCGAAVQDGGESESTVSRGEDTRRVAICNMDWDHVRAVDLLAVLRSFAPPGGVVYSVSIYPSEFGKGRMRDEAVHGPRIWDDGRDGGEESEEAVDLPGDGDGDGVDQEALRRYQRERMKYYYAVAECDSVGTGSAVYKELDGEEYLNSGVLLDIRFIPDDLSFDDDVPRETATEVPADYEPRQFVAAALQQSTVKLTWHVP